MSPARASQSRGSRRAAALWLLAGLLAPACGRRIDLPGEPDPTGTPSGQIAYVIKAAWRHVPAISDIDVRTRTGSLSVGNRQRVEIAKALSLNARLIIMDEPTSSLTLTETKRLLELVRELGGQGVSVVYISHRLGEVDECADRVVVLRDGKNAGELSRGEATHDKLVSLMVGREIKNFYVKSDAPRTPGFFRARNVSSPLYPDRSVSFDAARGETAQPCMADVCNHSMHMRVWRLPAAVQARHIHLGRQARVHEDGLGTVAD